jgi:hypothetical protein
MRFWMCVLLVAIGLFIAAAAAAMPPQPVYVCVAGGTWVAMLTAVLWVYTPQFNERYPIKSFTTVINAAVQPNQLLGLCGPLNDIALGFNLGRSVPTLPAIPEAIHYLGEGKEVFCVAEAEAYLSLIEEGGRPFRIVARQEFDRSILFLISNQH